MTKLVLQKIISGGQTGVDRAALDAALKYKLLIGGWCPKGRLAEDGQIPLRYSLLETVSENYSVRTRLNVEDSDATLIISAEPLSGGTHLTAAYASQVHKPLYILNGCKVNTTIFVELRCWLTTYKVRILNIAGPRGSQGEKVYQCAYLIICRLLSFLFY